MKRIIILVLASLLFSNARTQTISENTILEIAKSINTQKTANSKELLTTFFRAGLDNLLGEDKKFTLNSSFYGIDSIFRGGMAQKTSYETERKLRRNSLNLSLTGDSANNITNISSGFTFTLINKKDIVYTKMDKEDLDLLKRKHALIANLRKGWLNLLAIRHPQIDGDISLSKAIQLSWTEADKKEDYSGLHIYIKEILSDPELINEVLKLNDDKDSFQKNEIEEAVNSVKKGKNPAKALFKDIAEKYSRKPLWTFAPSAAYDRTNSQGEYSFASDFTVGLGKNLDRKPWELEIKSLFKIMHDTSQQKTNYDNKPFSISVGLNKVVMETDDNEPRMEFKLFTQYDYQFGKLTGITDASLFTLNSTLRLKVFNSLWLPITIKYDPENNNFLGFFSITANLGD
jgi:hypothetical protein